MAEAIDNTIDTTFKDTNNVPDVLTELFSFIETNRKKYIKNLETAVAIPSVSASLDKLGNVQRMVEWVAERLRDLGADVSLREAGTTVLPDGKTVAFPNILLGTLGDDPKKKTVCIYGHLDVQPALIEDGWDSEPFVLTERDGKLYGRGATDDKGPVLCWLHVIEAYQTLTNNIPVNLKFILEGMEESGSEGLNELLHAEKDTFLADVDYICISDNYWLGNEKPCITHGLRGLCYFYLNVECAEKDLHSGVFGGTVHEGMADLIYLLNTLVDKDGKILITDIGNDVAPLAPRENDIYNAIDFDIDHFRSSIGAKKLAHNEEKVPLLMHRWRYPSLSIHGIEGAFSQTGQKTVIPSRVVGKFSIRLVPNQDPTTIEKCVVDYLEKKWKERGTPNTLQVVLVSSSKAWTEDPNHANYEAAKRATQHVYNVEPDIIREGGSIPITVTLQEITGKNIILLPVGAGDDGAHSQNEKIDIRNYIQGTKLLGAYLYEISQL